MTAHDNILRYGFASIEALEGALARIEERISDAEKVNDEAWHVYNTKIAMKADVTVSAAIIDATAQKIEELCETRQWLEAKHEEWSREETASEHKEIERFLRR